MRLAAAAIFVILAVAPAEAAGVLAAFTVLGPQGAVARVVVDGGACPAIELDGKSEAMGVRAAPDARFPLICDALLPAATGSARIGAASLPLPRQAIGRIAVFGDSGCRVDARSGEVQPCNDAARWPFARTSGIAAALGPDLVIHVGDYLYRENACPPAYAGCAGSPSGDDWPAWQADFFAPAAMLLAAAPWVMVRGNHEICRRSGTGFFRLLDPRPLAAACPPVSQVYRVDAGDLVLFVLDSSEASDVSAPSGLVTRYRREFARIAAPRGSWLLSHRPLWAAARIGNAVGLSLIVNGNETLQAASDNVLPAGISLVLSGHIHLFEALSFVDHRPPQLVLGTAGSSLARSIDADLAGWQIGGTTIAYARTAQTFGVTTMERKESGWAATLRDARGEPLVVCTIVGPALTCRP
jgi:hypothetical protein